ncbi:hypothetical protein Deima_0709 [Deinococcus maricopensis DSM 21211]|uniref:Cytochrome c domain-containing protein n=1 Tax=Deinococcus maricopensis (strain DSM 21211 / LMG 22137 / NRRL B-23946 / LB-34) TaxID=709986 RepID=E8U5M6_DEIML|nr:hypothetical protein Deima_0709 [Deinococcus maricopensis DSM 21211]
MAVLVGAAALSVPVALAMPKYRTAAIQQLHYDVGNPLWQYDRTVMSCTFCHVNVHGGAPWNPFGEALRAGFRASPRADFGAVLYGVLRANGDADADGYPDAVEVYARTLPGDAQSHPERPLAELQAAFEAAGGVTQYAPKRRK